MRIKLDENLPNSLSSLLTDFGHDVDTILEEGLSGQNDDIVWEEAQKAGRFFITQDLDFSDTRKFLPGTHHGVLLIRLREPGRAMLFQRIETIFQMEEIDTWASCYVVATEHKIRIRRPSSDM